MAKKKKAIPGVKPSPTLDEIRRTSPVALFARLSLAVERGDMVVAAEAQAALERLGVIVRYGRAPEHCDPIERLGDAP